MLYYLKNYSGDNIVALVLKSDERFRCCAEQGMMVLRVCADKLELYQGQNLLDQIQLDLESACPFDEGDIVTTNPNGLIYRAFATEYGEATVFMGARCNSNCIMCPAGDAERRIGFSYSRRELLQFVDYLPVQLANVTITGGEPTLQLALFLETLGKIKEKYPTTPVLLLTNGRTLSDRAFYEKMLAQKPNRFRVAIPLHGSTAELHDKISRASGSFEQTMLGLRRLMNSDIQVEIRLVVTKVNCADLLNLAKLIAGQLRRVFCVNFVGLETLGNCAKNFDTVYLDHRDSFRWSKPAIELLVAQGFDVGLYNYPLCAVDRDFWPLSVKSISGYKNVFSPLCEACDVKSMCGGFFASTLRRAKPEIIPVHKEEIGDDKSL